MANPNGTPSNLIPWPKGVSGNAGGRAAGARNRLQGDFLNTLADHFAEKGKDAIERTWKTNPVAYIRAVASLMPKEFASAGPLDDMSDEDIRMMLALVKAARQQRLGQDQSA